MTKYQLAKLIQIAGGMDARKRMQKVVYLLQAAGCPFNADFFLHRFGPYSQEVAQLTDKLVDEGVLEETRSENGVGHQFGYHLTDNGETLVDTFEKKPVGATWRDQLTGFEATAKQLAGTDLRELEIASTIAFYHASLHDWDRAREAACEFKTIRPDTQFASRAEALARSVVD